MFEQEKAERWRREKVTEALKRANLSSKRSNKASTVVEVNRHVNELGFPKDARVVDTSDLDDLVKFVHSGDELGVAERLKGNLYRLRVFRWADDAPDVK